LLCEQYECKTANDIRTKLPHFYTQNHVTGQWLTNVLLHMTQGKFAKHRSTRSNVKLRPYVWLLWDNVRRVHRKRMWSSLCTTRTDLFKHAQTCSLLHSRGKHVTSVTRFSLTHSTHCHNYHHLHRLESNRRSLTVYFTVYIHTVASRILGPLLAEKYTQVSVYFKSWEFIIQNTCW
jgi:hypothetical protein